MNRQKKNIFLFTIASITFFLSAINSFSQSNSGTDFWFTFPQDDSKLSGAVQNAEKKLYLISRYDATVNIEWPAIPDLLPTIFLKGGVAQTVDLPAPYTNYTDELAEVVDLNGLHIGSDYPIAVYALSYNSISSELSPILPSQKLGKEYLSVAYREITDEANNFSARVQIVATKDNTVVNFELPENMWTSNEFATKQYKSPLEKWAINLKKGETYTIFCNDNGLFKNVKVKGATSKTGFVEENDGLNGLKISSSEDIAVVAGADCTYAGNKQYNGCGDCDITFSQLLPLDKWGTEFVTTQTVIRNNNKLPAGGNNNSSIADYLLVTAKEDGTTLKIEGAAQFVKTLNAGELFIYESPGQGNISTNPGASHHYLSSDKPIQLVQIQKGWRCDNNNQSVDPSQMLVFDRNTWKNNYYLTSPIGTSSYTNNFIILIVKDDGGGGTSKNIALNNSATGTAIPIIAGNWTQIGLTPFYYNRVSLPSPSAIKMKGDSVFSFYFGGNGATNSYAGMGGSSCEIEIFPSSDTINICDNNGGKLSTFKLEKVVNGKIIKTASTDLNPIYNWYPDLKNNPATVLTGSGPSYAYPDSGTYAAKLEFTDVVGCTAIKYFNVIVQKSLESPLVNVNVICAGESATAFANSSLAGINYFWFDSNGLDTIGKGQTLITDTLYKNKRVFVQIKNSKCASQKISIDIVVIPHPLSAQIVAEDTSILRGESTNISVKNIVGGSGNLKYQWNPNIGNGSGPYKINPKDSTEYFVTISEAQNTNNCSDITVALKIIVLENNFEIQIPNGFSPNTKDDNNSTFKIKAKGFTNFQLKIFNRWGKLIFQSTDVNDGWNGAEQNTGPKSPPGAFVYVITLNDDLGNPRTIKGILNLTL